MGARILQLSSYNRGRVCTTEQATALVKMRPGGCIVFKGGCQSCGNGGLICSRQQTDRTCRARTRAGGGACPSVDCVEEERQLPTDAQTTRTRAGERCMPLPLTVLKKKKDRERESATPHQSPGERKRERERESEVQVTSARAVSCAPEVQKRSTTSCSRGRRG